MLLCRGHHDIEDADPYLAQVLGIRVPREVWDANPVKARRAMEAQRATARTHAILPPPYWLRDDWKGVDGDRAERED
jgi:hypothetical protein